MSDANDSSQAIEVWHEHPEMEEIAKRPQSVQWFKMLHGSLNDGGQYGMPRSGLVYQKIDGDHWRLVKGVSPSDPQWDPHPETKKQHNHYQVLDFHFFYYVCRDAGVRLDESEVVNIPGLAMFAKPRPGKSRPDEGHGLGRTS